VYAVLGVSRDVTERKQSEEKGRSLQEQLSHAQRMESVGRLAGGVAHDFNNLLTVILGHLELLIGDLPPYGTPLRSSLAEIQSAAERARDLTGQLLAFGRRQTLLMKPMNLNELIKSFSGILRRLIGEDIEVVTHLGEDVEPVSADPSQIEQVLMNLAVNARDAMPLGGCLTIETFAEVIERAPSGRNAEMGPGRYSVLSVRDTGTGMDDDTLKRIFDPFFTTKEVGRGTGLGLSTVYGIVKQHGGHISVESNPGSGSAFTVRLPVASESPCIASEPVPSGKAREESRTVLVVEDDVSVRQLVCRMLRDAGFTAIECQEPLQAAGAAEAADALDLVVTDVVMPGLGGSQVFEQVSAVRPGVRVLFISGYAGETLALHGVSDKGVGFLQKPFTTEAFLRKVREVLE
jgi:two-component system cell cycle sensor histidine kinase/response regulator CckA